jgi:hypothetical protein
MICHFLVNIERPANLVSCLYHGQADGNLVEKSWLDALTSGNLQKSYFDPTHFRYEAVHTHTGYR